jgi:hypothetical protein
MPAARSPDSAVTIDLTLIVPALYWFLLVRGRGWPVVTVLPVFLGSFLFASLILPPDRQATLHLIKYLAVAAELGLIGVLIHRTVRAVSHARGLAGRDMLDRVRAAVRGIMPYGRAADLVASEVAVIAYALLSWRMAPIRNGNAFTYHRKSGYGALVGALLLAIAVEIIPVHVLLSQWSGGVAWIASGLAVYGGIWLVGDLRAMQLRPITIEEDRLVVRFGLRWSMSVPLDRIEAVRFLGRSVVRDSVDLRVVLPGEQRLSIQLASHVDAVGFYGLRRRVRSCELGVDDPAGLRAILESHVHRQG